MSFRNDSQSCRSKAVIISPLGVFIKEPNSYGFSSNNITPEACELLLLINPSIPIIISNKPGYWFTSLINVLIGFLFLSGLPFNTSDNGHKNPRSLGISELKYCAISTSIPSGYSSER